MSNGSDGPLAGLSSAAIYADFAAKLDKEDGFAYYKAGDMDAVEGKAAGVAKTVKAEYRAPYLAHAAMEPVNCTAQVKDGMVHLWAPTQSPGFAVEVAAKVAGVPADKVVLTVTMLGGGFGRRLDVDMVAQAVAIAKQADGYPVQTDLEPRRRHHARRLPPGIAGALQRHAGRQGQCAGLR
jgi:isoquinoline 1-oxidoreductase beta subunit